MSRRIKLRFYAAAFCLGIVLGGLALDAIDPPEPRYVLNVDYGG